MSQATTSTTRGIPVHLEKVRRTFPGPVHVIDGITLNVAAGEFVAILGPSGCGKSTLLRLIAGLDHANSGEVVAAVAPHSVAYVFQDAHLLPWRNVLRNVEMPLELIGVPATRRRDEARVALKQVGLTEAISRYPAQLSGGMRMRVSLARALVTNPKLLLLDEPFAALDEITRQKLDEQLRELWVQRGMTVLFVTHSTSEAVFLADRAVVLTTRPAQVVEDRAIDLPQERIGPLRATAQFAQQTRYIYEALERGGA